MITAYPLLRSAPGLNFLLHSLVKIANGRAVFAATWQKEFAGIPRPGHWVERFGRYLPHRKTVAGLPRWPWTIFFEHYQTDLSV